MKPVGIYVRVSTNGQDHETQLDELRAIAKARGWDTVEYIDTGSGVSKKLLARDDLLRDARRGKLGTVLVWRFDRFARSTQQLVEAMENFRVWGVEFISLREGIDTTTPAGRFVFTVFAGIAEFEREVIKERVKAGMAKAKRHGTKSGKPIGRPKRHVDVDRVLELRDGGLSWSAIARELDLPRSTIMDAIRKAEAAA